MKMKTPFWILLSVVVHLNLTAYGATSVATTFTNNGEWVTSGDAVLSLRISTDKSTYRTGDAVRVRIEIKNNSKQEIRVPSLEDEGYPSVTGPKEIKYIGPQVSRPPQPEVVLKPGESAMREVLISGENWGRLDLPGKYVASFFYRGPPSRPYEGLKPSVSFNVERMK